MNAVSKELGAEVAALIEVLHATDQRLEELLAGEVDSVTAKDGRTTLLRRAQGHLRQSENARQAAILNALPAHIALLDTQGVIVSVNHAWCKFAKANALGSASNAIGINYLAICDQAQGTDSSEAKQVAAGVRSVLDGKAESFSIRYPCHSPTEQRWFQLTVTPLADDHMRGAVVMHLNVTDRVLVEEEQRVTQQLLNNIVENIPTAVQLKSVSDGFRIQLWNKASEVMYGVPREAAIGRTVHDIWPTADADRMSAADHELLASGYVQDFPDRRVPTNTRGFIRTHMRKVALHDASGKPSHVLVIADDITMQKDAEAALWESETKFRTLAEAMPQIVWVKQDHGGVAYFNDQWMQYTGLTLEESIGRGWKTALHPDDRQQAEDSWEQACAAKCIFSIESRLRRADGVYRWWLIRAVPTEGDAGNAVKWIGTCTDIDELKQAQLEISHVNEALHHRQLDLVQLAARLEDGHSQLIAAQALAKVGSWSTDLATGVVAWSAETHRIFGTDPATFQPTHPRFLDRIHPDDRMAASEAFQRSITDRSIVTVQHRVLLSSGVVKSVEERWQVFDDAHGQPVRAAGTCQDITERRRAERELAALSERTERRERMLQLMLSSITDFAYIFDREGRLLFANQPMLDLWGINLEQAVGKNSFDLGYPAELAERLQRQVRQVFDTGENVSDDTPYVSPTGVQGYYEYTFSPAFAADSSVEFVAGSSRDITARKRAETALRQSETEFRTLAEAMPQIVWATRADGWNIYFSQQWMDYTGLTLEESLGHGWNKPFHPDDQQRAWDAWQHATATNGIYSIESRLRRADGEYRWWLVRGVPSLDGDGNVVKWFGTCTDIHDLKVAELEVSRVNRELRRHTTELQVLFDLVPAMIWFKDTDNNILRANASAAKAVGRTVEEIEGRSSLDFYPENAAQVHAEDLEVIRSGIPMLGVVQAVTVAGKDVWIHRDKVPYRDEGGNVIGIVSMAQDITERKRDQDALQELNAQLETRVLARTTELKFARDEARTANEAKSAFLAAMSHEIRTPMNGVIGMIEVLHQTSLKGPQVEILDVIRESAFALLQIIEDILDFSKIEAGKLTVENEPLELADMVEKACGMLDHLAVKQGVHMTVFIDPSIPGALVGDAGRLRQVLINLAGNAIKFSGGREQPGQVSVRVLLVERHAQAVTIELVVADNGIGIEEATLARLFTPFSQADVSTTRRFGGTGLGLAICSMLVRLMDGTIAVQSVPGGGSTFTVRLRLAALEGTAHVQQVYAPVQGLRCRIVGQDVPLGEDIAATLGHAQVTVERSPDLAGAASARPPGPEVWLILPGITVPDPAQLRAMCVSTGRSDAETRFIVLGWGKRRRPRLAAADLVFLDVDTLLRRTLMRTLALVAGRVEEQSAVDEPDLEAPGQAPTRQDARLRGRLILVAEDNETNRIVILRQLALIGCAAQIAVNGREALELWRTGDFALLLTDLHMPQMDGYALTEAIRAEEVAGRRIPIIALTANALRDEERRCLAAGMDAYLTKPVRLAQLKASMETWIGPSVEAPVSAKCQIAPAATPAADLSILTALVGDDPTVIDEVLQAFRATIALSTMALEQGASPGSGQAVADAAHKLKSAARSIGALRLGDLCAQIEQVAQAQRSRELTALLPLFHAESQAVLRFLEAR